MSESRTTVLVLGDQLRRDGGALAGREAGECRVLLVESEGLLRRQPVHRQRAHLVLSAMRHFVTELRTEGFDVDLRRASSLEAGLEAHRRDASPKRIVAAAPTSHAAGRLFDRCGVEVVSDDFFAMSIEGFGAWAAGRKRLRMEDFYRAQRLAFEVLLDGDEPAGGRWNFDHDNREPPPRDGRAWPTVERFGLDEVDRAVIDELEGRRDVELVGAPPSGWWPVTRAQAVRRLRDFIDEALPVFGAHEDAMLHDEWKLAHSALSSSLNLGLLHPLEVVRAAEAAYRDGRAPINGVEGFVRQVLGWREYVRGLYWHFGPDYRHENELGAQRPIPPVLAGEAPTDMACVASALAGVHERAYAHHIERLMVLGNLGLLAGIDPWALTRWMWGRFVDGAEWVMLPNVIGMALWADGGRMATKPYAAGGAYINKMSDHCRGCRFDPRKRTGETACPFTTLYWDFLARNENRLRANPRVGQQLAGMRRLADLEATRERAGEVLVALDHGTL